MQNTPKRLYRSNSNRILGGVCGGIAEYFSVDPVIIRLIWIVFTVIYGFGVFLYLIAWVIIPRSPEDHSPPNQGNGASPLDMASQKALVALGLILVLVGVLEATRLSDPIKALAAIAFSFPFVFIWLGILVIVISLLSRR